MHTINFSPTLTNLLYELEMIMLGKSVLPGENPQEKLLELLNSFCTRHQPIQQALQAKKFQAWTEAKRSQELTVAGITRVQDAAKAMHPLSIHVPGA